MSLYGKLQYWQDRYSRNPQPFDWYQRFYSFKEHVTSSISNKNPQCKILIPGCGNSRLSQQMIEQGYSMVYNIDNSITCTKNMTQKYKQKTQKIKFECMDVRQMAYANQTFDGIVDKALIDSIMCGQNGLENCYKALCEIYRVLKKKGNYIHLSYQSPTKRISLLQRNQFNWKVKVIKIPKPISSSFSYRIELSLFVHLYEIMNSYLKWSETINECHSKNFNQDNDSKPVKSFVNDKILYTIDLNLIEVIIVWFGGYLTSLRMSFCMNFDLFMWAFTLCMMPGLIMLILNPFMTVPILMAIERLLMIVNLTFKHYRSSIFILEVGMFKRLQRNKPMIVL